MITISENNEPNNKSLRISLAEKIRDCKECPLYLSMPEGCRPVPGEGIKQPKLMFIVENLTDDEAIIERPMMGIAGQFLDKVLKKLDIERESCYITHAVKCRSKNRVPSMTEKKVCGEWLKQEIAEIVPKHVVTMGLWPSRYILGLKSTVKLDDVLGKVHSANFGSKMYHVTPCYNPQWVIGRSKKDVERFESILGETYNAVCSKE